MTARPDPFIITLKRHELFMGAQAGMLRRLSALRRQRQERRGTPPQDLWGIDIEASLAELAVAKAFGLYWERFADTPSELEGDVGRLQVRSTWRDNGRLILHREDKDDAAFVLVTGRAPTYTIRGWIAGAKGKQEQWWNEGDGRPAFFVPQDALSLTTPPAAGGTVPACQPGSESSTTATP